VGPTPAYSDCGTLQGSRCSPRRRRCLLKGCESWFRSLYPLARYCSASCRQAARQWSRWRANRRYRRSEEGKERRRAQCQRRRERVRSRASSVESGEATEREGYPKADARKKIACIRPGCYEGFAASRRSPLKKFCSPLCRKALRRVLQRELRWRRRVPQLASPGGDSFSPRC
jgi:hypothetical protein